MNILFALGDRASAEDIRAAAQRPAQLLRRARDARQARGQRLRPASRRRPSLRLLPHHAAANRQRAAVQQLLSVFFGGSPGETATALLKDENWTDDELESLSAEIERIRNERRRS